MTVVPLDTSLGVAIGNDAGWALTVHSDRSLGQDREIGPAKLVISRDDYYANIQAALPGDLSGGRYTFTIEGLTDANYADIHVDDVVRLYLFWRDTNASPAGYLSNIAGLTDLAGDISAEALKDFLVAELVVTRVSRKAGARRYETTIDAKERAFVRLQGRMLAKTLVAATYRDAVEKLADGLNIPLDFYGFTPSGTLAEQHSARRGADGASFQSGESAARAMRRLGKAIEDVKRKYGRGMLLLHKGTLVVGERPIPWTPNAIVNLSYLNGLIEAVLDAPQTEPKPDDQAQRSASTGRTQYHLTLKGRPDIAPGDVVRFAPASEDVSKTTPGGIFTSLVASVAGPLFQEEDDPSALVTLYVNAVEHRLGRTSAFVTSISGVVIGMGEQTPDPWDPTPAASAALGAANPALATAQAIRSTAEDIAGSLRSPDVGEVRAVLTRTMASEPPGQTETVWRGLEQSDGRPNQARRLDISRKPPEMLEGVAYASPFAWGLTGLVLPRYPGTRVVLAHRNGDPSDPVDVGALWESGTAPDSEPGDWWLILPVGMDAAGRTSLEDSDRRPDTWGGPVTQDLIDADGNRVIHVGELTMRVGALKSAGNEQRAERAPLEHGITIEHAVGDARITIDQKGKIVVQAKGNLELVSREGNITLSAPKGSVDVSVGNAMEVH